MALREIGGFRTVYHYGDDTRLDALVLPDRRHIHYEYGNGLMPVRVLCNDRPAPEYAWSDGVNIHGLWAYWGAVHDWTSILLYALSEAPICAAFFHLFRKEDAAKAVRTAYSFLAAKTILVDLLIFWATRRGLLEDAPPDSVALFPPLAGLPAMAFLGIQFAALGIYVYKLTNDPARWKIAIWV